jgi:hypothetical protein
VGPPTLQGGDNVFATKPGSEIECQCFWLQTCWTACGALGPEVGALYFRAPRVAPAAIADNIRRMRTFLQFSRTVIKALVLARPLMVLSVAS